MGPLVVVRGGRRWCRWFRVCTRRETLLWHFALRFCAGAAVCGITPGVEYQFGARTKLVDTGHPDFFSGARVGVSFYSDENCEEPAGKPMVYSPWVLPTEEWTLTQGEFVAPAGSGLKNPGWSESRTRVSQVRLAFDMASPVLAVR